MFSLVLFLLACQPVDREPMMAATTSSVTSTAPDVEETCRRVETAVAFDDATLGFSAKDLAERFDGVHVADALDGAGAPAGQVSFTVTLVDDVVIHSWEAAPGATCPSERTLDVLVDLHLTSDDGAVDLAVTTHWNGEALPALLQVGAYASPGALTGTLAIGDASELWVQGLVDSTATPAVLTGELQAIYAPDGGMVTEETLLVW